MVSIICIRKTLWALKINMIELVEVKGGHFIMGSDTFEIEESPSHVVEVTSFFIGKYLITQAQWSKYIGKSNPYNKGEKKPIEQVSWIDAIAFCNVLSKEERLNPCYSKTGNTISFNKDANGYRLPTEAEWEFAARGGLESRGFIYSGSNNPFEVGWFKDNANRCTHEVGQLKANELGLYDMSGNVYEHCWDIYKQYKKEKQINPLVKDHSTENERHVLRGGNCHGFSNRLRCTSRQKGLYKGFVQDFVGFRIARNA